MRKADLIKAVEAEKTKDTVRKIKAEDMDALVAALLTLPPGQLRHVLTDEVKTVLEKYGYKEA